MPDVLGDLLAQVFVFGLLGSLVYGLTRLLRFDHRRWSFDDPRRAALQGTFVVVLGWVLLAIYMLALSTTRDTVQPHPSVRVYSAPDVGYKLLRASLAFGPTVFFLLRRREGWNSAGVSSHNLGRSALVGVLLSAIVLGAVITRPGNDVVTGALSASHAWALVYYTITGFGEEFVFRGFLQTRLVAWMGSWPGWIATSVLMSMSHVPQRITFVGMSLPDALVSSIMLVPINLLMGFIMLRTDNVLASSLFHVFADWANTLT